MDRKNGKHVVCILFLAAIVCVSAVSETFEYKYAAGNKYRILSVVEEDVYINHRFNHRARILNRVSVNVADDSGASARHEAVFSTSEQVLEGGGSFRWSREYQSIFGRDKLGVVSISPEYYMPVVRNVPVFPGRDLKQGDSWTAPGHEMHDFRTSFGIEEPYRIPFDAKYVYVGSREWKGKQYPAFSVSYRIFYEPPAVNGRIWPRRIMGASDQLVYWDTELGQAVAYSEQFRMIFELSNGATVEYRGKAEAEIIESEIMKKEEIAEKIADEINRLGIDDASVRVADEGVVINLEDIQFLPESAVLRESEKTKLQKIGEILKQYPDRDILVGGHTALAGTEAGRMRLSRERAGAVADYLISRGVREAPHMVVRGYGAENPVADNRTEEGMRRNRRVEITILEN